MANRKDVTVPLPKDAVDEIDGKLSYGDSRAGWIREAVYQRLEREGINTEEFRKELGDPIEGDEGNPNRGPEAVPVSN